MKPLRIVLIRHGQSQFNADRSLRELVPDYKVGLTALGWQQAEEAGAKLAELFNHEPVKVYCSPYARARDTLNGINNGALKWGDNEPLNMHSVYEDPRLREQDFGHLRASEAFHLIDQERDAYGTFYYRIPDGEAGSDVFDRISNFLNTLWRDFEKEDYPQNVLIVSHGLTIRLFLMRWFHWAVEEFEQLRNLANCQYVIMERKANAKIPRGHIFDDKFSLITPVSKYTEDETKQWRNEKAGKPWMR